MSQSNLSLVVLVKAVPTPKQPKQPAKTEGLSVFAPPSGGALPTSGPSPTSAGVWGGFGAGSRGGKVLGSTTTGNNVYESEKKDRSGLGSSGGPKGQTAKEFSKGDSGDLTEHYRGKDLHSEDWGPRQGRSSYGAVMFNDKGHVLLRKPTNHFDGYHWTFPKGRRDSGEHPVDAAHREVQEETGYRGKIVGHVPGGHRSGFSTSHFYLMHPAEHVPHKMDWETSETKWAHPDEAKQLINQSTNIKGRQRDHQILDAALKTYKQDSQKSIDLFVDLRKAVPIGTVHQWADGSYKKVSEGEWVPVTEPGHPDHPIDDTGQDVPGAVPVEGAEAETTSNPWRLQFGKFGIKMGFPPADMPPENVEIDLDGDIHSKAILKWRHPKSGKWQYGYSEEYHFRNSEKKWSRISGMDEDTMDKFERKLIRGMSSKNEESERQAALAAYIIYLTGMRPGDVHSPKHSKDNKGLTTLTVNNIKIDGDSVVFDFIGKAGIHQVHELTDRRTARHLRRLVKGKKPDDLVFGETYRQHLNRWISDTGADFTAKDLRTHFATRLAAQLLDDDDLGPPPPISDRPSKTQKDAKAKAKIVAEEVSRRLGNTASVAKSSYIHPNIWKAWATKLSIEAGKLPLPKAIRRHVEMSKSKRSPSVWDIAQNIPVKPHKTIPEKEEIEWYPLPDWLESINPEEDDSSKSLESELRVGAKEELEHTDDPKEAKKIAMDHLKEDPQYYTKLEEAGLVDKSVVVDLFVGLSKGRALENRCKFQGLEVSIETDKGSIRSGKDPDGNEWSIKMKYPYGYIRQTTGEDGEHLDCYVGPHSEATHAYVIRQKNPWDGTYDEDKVMLGFDSAEAAKKAYLAHYDNPEFFDSMRAIAMDAFKALLKTQKGKKLNLTNESRYMTNKGSIDLFVALGNLKKARDFKTDEQSAKISAERPFRNAGLANPSTPDDPAVGKDWHDEFSEEEEQTEYNPDERYKETQASDPYRRAQKRRQPVLYVE